MKTKLHFNSHLTVILGSLSRVNGSIVLHKELLKQGTIHSMSSDNTLYWKVISPSLVCDLFDDVYIHDLKQLVDILKAEKKTSSGSSSIASSGIELLTFDEECFVIGNDQREYTVKTKNNLLGIPESLVEVNNAEVEYQISLDYGELNSLVRAASNVKANVLSFIGKKEKRPYILAHIDTDKTSSTVKHNIFGKPVDHDFRYDIKISDLLFAVNSFCKTGDISIKFFKEGILDSHLYGSSFFEFQGQEHFHQVAISLSEKTEHIQKTFKTNVVESVVQTVSDSVKSVHMFNDAPGYYQSNYGHTGDYGQYNNSDYMNVYSLYESMNQMNQEQVENQVSQMSNPIAADEVSSNNSIEELDNELIPELNSVGQVDVSVDVSDSSSAYDYDSDIDYNDDLAALQAINEQSRKAA